MTTLFSTKERIRILETVVLKTERIGVSSLAAELGLSKAFVSRYLDMLTRGEIVRRVAGKYEVKESSPLLKGIRIFLTLRRMNARIFKKYAFVQAAGLYGSCARGENIEDSDTDLWVKISSANDQEQAALIRDVKKRVRNAKVLVLTEAKIKQLRQEDELFYHALTFGSIQLCGASDALHV